ncbi:MAG: Holliday junction resolvase RuvX [Fimbriimonadaceae bacterium]|nr:Holliday junction resolvase RuvX [Chitinophagales bacterium]
MGRILAIDYGAKRVGLAVTDTLQMSANGLDTIVENKTIDFLKKYIAENEVEKIIIGFPANLDGTDTHATQLVRNFIVHLQKTFPGIPVIKRDEAYTSKMAVRALIDSGMKKMERRKKENIDKMSAVLILQEYLQSL